jgi:tripartite ATP-independent transporter DctM subunit
LSQTRIDPTLAPPGTRLAIGQRWRALREVWGVALLFAAVIGGIYLGWFSPTEAAAVGAFGAFLFALLRRALTPRILVDCMSEAAAISGMIFLILIGAAVFNYFVETSGPPQLLVQLVHDLGLGRYAVLLVLMGCYIVHSLSMILLTVPFVFPLVAGLQINPIWFGILLVTVVELGLITLPIGMNLFVLRVVADDLPLGTIIRGILPFILADIARLAILLAIPGISLWLPARMQ